MTTCTVLRRGHDRYETQPGIFFVVEGTAAEQRAAAVAIVAALSRGIVGCVLACQYNDGSGLWWVAADQDLSSVFDDWVAQVAQLPPPEGGQGRMAI